jgi:glycerol-3-phosphate dehydrogenase
LRFELDAATLKHLIRLYADGAAEIVRVMHARPELGKRLAPDSETVGAEVVHVIRKECAVRLSDILVRRTAAGSAESPSADTIQNAARLAGAELGWDEPRISAEVADVKRFYESVPV